MTTTPIDEQLPAPVPAHKARAFEMDDWEMTTDNTRDDKPNPVVLVIAAALIIGIPNLIVGFVIGMVVTL